MVQAKNTSAHWIVVDTHSLILLSRSKFGLQKSLDDLHSWSKKWLMEINLKKTRITIIEKQKTRKASPKFNLGNRNIAIV